MGAPTPAGWYPDPSDPARNRYFDGAAWTDNYYYGSAPSAHAAPPHQTRRPIPKAGWYSDPHAPRNHPRRRYWDGQQWTNHYTEAAVVGGQKMNMTGRVIIGIFLAWVVVAIAASVAEDGEGNFWAGLAAGIVIVSIFFVPIWWGFGYSRRLRERQERQDRNIELAIHAEAEHNAYLRGENDRGIYGQYPPPPT